MPILRSRGCFVRALWLLVWLLPLAKLAAEPLPAGEPSPEPALSQRLDRASEFFEKGDYEAARREYERATKEDPGSIPAWRGLGWTLWHLGERERALRVWNDLLKVRPNEPELLLALAQAYEQREEWGQAMQFYDKLLGSKSRPRDAHLGRARVFRATRKFSAAEEEIQRVLADSPADLDAQFLLAGISGDTGRWAEAKRILDRLIVSKPELKTLRAHGDAATELGQFDEAVNDYRHALKIRPDDRGTIVGLFRAYAKSHHYSEAVELLRRYLASHPADDDVREQLARIAGLSGHAAEAEREWRFLIRKQPQETNWRANLASLLHGEGRYDEAVALAREVLATEPTNASALALLADDAVFSGRDEEAVPWLERLVVAAPSVARLDQLANLHLGIGDRFTDDENPEQAKKEYAVAAQEYARARELDPTDGEAILGRITALRLLGNVREAIDLATEVNARYPRMERGSSELQQVYSEIGNYDAADHFVSVLRGQFPNHVRFEQEHARALFFGGERRAAIESLEELLRKPIRPAVPVLLYHGITRSGRENAVPLENFIDQIQALKREGYQPVTVADLVDFLENRGSLPSKPILITFDDARADSFRNADSVLQEAGFRAAMFVPVDDVNRHLAFYASWDLIRSMQKSGRWEVQCHGFEAHRRIPVDGDGHTGIFLVNRQWLEGERRLETEQEYVARIERDYEQCREVLTREVRGADVTAYAFPFGDLGQKSLSNVSNAFDLNQQILSRHFRIAFIETPVGFVTRDLPRYLLSRFEVPRDYRGADLIRYLKTAEPRISTLFLLADFHSWSGDYRDALAVYDQLARENADPTMLLERRSQVFSGRGDFAAARALLEAAAGRNRESRVALMYPETRRLATRLDALDARIRPALQFEASYYADNRDRSNLSFSPLGRVYLNDRFSLSAHYRYGEYIQDKFDFSGLTPSPTPPAGSSPGGAVATEGNGGGSSRGRLQAVGNEGEIQIDYVHDWSTGFSLSGGVADFTDRSSSRVFGKPDPVPLGSGRFSLGLGDAVDVTLGGTHGYVGAAGAILDNLGFSASTERMRVRPTDWLTFSARHAFTYYDDRNRRNTAFAALLARVWEQPAIETGYQFTYDDTLRSSSFFFTPDELMAHEGVLSLRWSPGKIFVVGTTMTAGVGKERGGNVEPQASVAGELEFRLGDRFSLFGRGGRSQSARFESVQADGGMFFRF